MIVFTVLSKNMETEDLSERASKVNKEDNSNILLWIPYTAYAFVLVLLALISFCHYHFKNKRHIRAVFQRYGTAESTSNLNVGSGYVGLLRAGSRPKVTNANTSMRFIVTKTDVNSNGNVASLSVPNETNKQRCNTRTIACNGDANGITTLKLPVNNHSSKATNVSNGFSKQNENIRLLNNNGISCDKQDVTSSVFVTNIQPGANTSTRNLEMLREEHSPEDNALQTDNNQREADTSKTREQQRSPLTDAASNNNGEGDTLILYK